MIWEWTQVSRTKGKSQTNSIDKQSHWNQYQELSVIGYYQSGNPQVQKF